MASELKQANSRLQLSGLRLGITSAMYTDLQGQAEGRAGALSSGSLLWSIFCVAHAKCATTISGHIDNTSDAKNASSH